MSFADPSELRHIAERIDAHADQVRQTATTLRQAVGVSNWRGFAADAFAFEARGIAGRHNGAADQLNRAAGALRRHADSVDTELAIAKAAVSAAGSILHAVGL